MNEICSIKLQSDKKRERSGVHVRAHGVTYNLGPIFTWHVLIRNTCFHIKKIPAIYHSMEQQHWRREKSLCIRLACSREICLHACARWSNTQLWMQTLLLSTPASCNRLSLRCAPTCEGLMGRNGLLHAEA